MLEKGSPSPVSKMQQHASCLVCGYLRLTDYHAVLDICHSTTRLLLVNCLLTALVHVHCILCKSGQKQLDAISTWSHAAALMSGSAPL